MVQYLYFVFNILVFDKRAFRFRGVEVKARSLYLLLETTRNTLMMPTPKHKPAVFIL